MLRPGERAYWWQGWSIPAGVASLTGALAYAATHRVEPTSHLGPPLEMVYWGVVAGLIAVLLWLPIAWWSWQTYTQPVVAASERTVGGEGRAE